MKRMLSAALSLCLATSCFVFPAKAAQAPSDQPPLLIAPAPSTADSSNPSDPTAGGTPTSDQVAPTEPIAPSFSDLSGHWAKEILLRAVSDGYLTGYADGTMRPDKAISQAEIRSILCKVWQTEEIGSGDDISMRSNNSCTRSDAFVLLDRTFCLSTGQENGSLKSYADASSLSAVAQSATSALLSCGAVKGYADGTLRPQAMLSRAEFLTLLYRLLPTASSDTTLPTVQKAPILLTEPSALKDLTLEDTLYLSGGAGEMNLSHVTAERVILRTKGNTSTLSLTGDTKIKTLVIAFTTDLTLKTEAGSSVDTVILLSNKSKLSLVGQISRVEVLGDNNTLNVNAALDSLLVSGACNELLGSGSVKMASVSNMDNKLSLAAEKTEEARDEGIKAAEITLVAPATLPVGGLLTVTATVKNPLVRDCRAVWLVGNRVVKETALTVGPDGVSTQYLAEFSYKQTMNTDFSLRFELRYSNQVENQTISAESYTKLENYSLAYYTRYETDQVLARVTTGYQGDYTLAWAQKNDYDTPTKEIWVNTKGYTSKTKYLVWINIATQHVNIFEGSKNHWTLVKSYLGGSGKSGDDTPVGVYTVGTRTAAGWTTDTYNVSPVLRFWMGSGLAFHSRIYDPEHTRITDGSIGYPISHGCIRMYDDDIWWMYDHIPQGTTVVVF